MPKYKRVFELELVILGARAGGNDEVGFGCCLVLTYWKMIELNLVVVWCQNTRE